jgi:hypothetical protein
MARIYARFDHGVESGLEARSTGNYYERRVIGSTTSSATLRAGLISSRSALSTAMYGQMDDVNKDGGLGIIIPSDVITRGGGNLSFTNLYKTTTIPGVVWPSDPRVRPTASIVSTDGNLTAVSPTDSGTIQLGYYDSASNAVITVTSTEIKDQRFSYIYCGPYSRLGNNVSRTLHSIWHDHDLQYFAWDDFTPGTPQTLTGTVNNLGSWDIYSNVILLEPTENLPITASWTGLYASDLAGTSSLTASLWRNSGNIQAASVTSASYATPTATATYNWNGVQGLGAVVGGYQYNLSTTMSFTDAIIPTHTSSKLSTSTTDIVRVLQVRSVSLRYAANLNGLCGTNGTTGTFYLNNSTSATSGVYIFSLKYPITIPAAGSPTIYYTDSATSINNGDPIYYHDGGGLLQSTTATCP